MSAPNCALDSSDSPGPISALPHAAWTVDAGTVSVSTGVDRYLPTNTRRVASPHVALPEPVAVARTSTLQAIRGALSTPTLKVGPSSVTTLTVTSIEAGGPAASLHAPRSNARPAREATPRRGLATTMGVLRDPRNSRALPLAIEDPNRGVAPVPRPHTSDRRRLLPRPRL